MPNALAASRWPSSTEMSAARIDSPMKQLMCRLMMTATATMGLMLRMTELTLAKP